MQICVYCTVDCAGEISNIVYFAVNQLVWQWYFIQWFE